jgi:hypothetical protein
MTPEGRIKQKVDRMLARSGCWWFSPQAGPFGRAGVPDRIACVNGHLVGIECKADATKKPTRLQIATIEKMRASGASVFVVYDDVTLADAERHIKSCSSFPVPAT